MEQELAVPRSWTFRVERRQENITAEQRVITLHLKPIDKDEADVTSMKVNVDGDSPWWDDMTPEKFATVEVTFGTKTHTADVMKPDG